MAAVAGVARPARAQNSGENLRARRRGRGRRLAMAARRRPARKAGLQSLHADADRARRALHLLFERRRPRHAHCRRRQRRALEGLDGICLVAHSYAGWPCGAALDRTGDKVASVVWLDAFKPEDGRALIDLVALRRGDIRRCCGARRARHAAVAEAVDRRRQRARRSLVRAKLTPQPIATYVQSLRYGGGLERIAKKTYVRLPDFPNPTFDRAYSACKADESWSTRRTRRLRPLRHARRAGAADGIAAARRVRAAVRRRLTRLATANAAARQGGRASRRRPQRRRRRRSPRRSRDVRGPKRASGLDRQRVTDLGHDQRQAQAGRQLVQLRIVGEARAQQRGSLLSSR